MREVKLVLAALTTAALLLPSRADAQFAVGGGPSIPVGDFADEAVDGWHVRGSADFSPRVLPFGLRADLFYQTFDNVERAPGINVTLGGEWFSQMGILLNAVYDLELGRFEPYALFGGGILREWHGDRSYNGTEQFSFVLNAGLGLGIAVVRDVDLFIEARQVNFAGGSELELSPPAVLDEVKFKSTPITIGVRF